MKLLLGTLGALLWLERRRPLRRRVEPGMRRVARNLAVGAITAGAVAALERPLVGRAARLAERRRFGLVPALGLPPALATALAVLLFDYTLYWWHVLLHRVPLLWRFHLAHHVDLDLDASTAARFHFVEFLLSIPWRLAQVVLIGATPRSVALWGKLTLAEVFFHHSNLRLPLAVERALRLALVTPRMHGIHHSMVRAERDSNFSSGLAAWDLLHGTLRTNVPQEAIVIGVPGHGKTTLGQVLLTGLPHPERAAHPG